MFPNDWEIEFVAVGRELRESVLWSPGLKTTTRRAIVLSGDRADTLTEGGAEPVVCGSVGNYVYDPNPAVGRAGLIDELATSLHAAKLDPQIAFLTGDVLMPTPFARVLPVIESMPWHEREVKAELKRLGVGRLDVRRRGLAGDVEAITKRLKATGPVHAVLLMTRLQGRPWAIICAAGLKGREGE